MELNANFDIRAAAHGAKLDWLASPMTGVERRMLERIGDEVARATTIVRFAPGSAFSPHVHTGGEEFLVLDGIFQDEQGDFPAGSYVRNPPGSRHKPGSLPGCTIFVKLWQMEKTDTRHVVIDTKKADAIPAEGRPHVGIVPLFKDDRETVRLERWDADAAIGLSEAGGIEILVLEGGFAENGESFAAQSWLRLPPGMDLEAKAGPSGCLCWIKTGHLGTRDREAFSTQRNPAS